MLSQRKNSASDQALISGGTHQRRHSSVEALIRGGTHQWRHSSVEALISGGTHQKRHSSQGPDSGQPTVEALHSGGTHQCGHPAQGRTSSGWPSLPPRQLPGCLLTGPSGHPGHRLLTRQCGCPGHHPRPGSVAAMATAITMAAVRKWADVVLRTGPIFESSPYS